MPIVWRTAQISYTAAVLALALPASAADWPQSRGDEQCSGSSPAITAPLSPVARTWSFDGSGRTWGYQPGMTVWSSPAIAEVKGRAILAVGSYDNKLYCLDAATGEPLWTFTAGEAISATPAFWRDQARVWLYIAADDRLVYALDADSGRQIWVHTVQAYRPTLGGARLSSPAVGDVGGRVALFVGHWVWDNSLGASLQRGGLTALDARDGRPIWTAELGDNQLTAPLFVRQGPKGHSWIYIGSYNGSLYALSATDGKLIWSHQELDAVRAPPAYVTTPSGPLVIATSKYGTVRGLRAESGQEKWQYKTGDRITASPTVYSWNGSPRAIVGSYDRGLYCLDADTGRLYWRYQARGGVYSSAAIAMDPQTPMALVSAWDDSLHAVSLADGTALFRRFTGRPLWDVAGLDDSNWSSPITARINGSWMAFAGSYDGVLRGFALNQTAEPNAARRSNLAFWLSFPVVLLPVALLAIVTTRRYRRRNGVDRYY